MVSTPNVDRGLRPINAARGERCCSCPLFGEALGENWASVSVGCEEGGWGGVSLSAPPLSSQAPPPLARFARWPPPICLHSTKDRSKVNTEQKHPSCYGNG